MLIALLAYLAVGLVAGFLAGLLGVGGGMVIVPALLYVFHLTGVAAEFQQHLALGTSLATILFTSVSSLKAHHARGAVLWSLLRTITPGILVGTFVGAQLAGQVSAVALKWFFVAFAYLIALQMLLDLRPKASRELPGKAGVGVPVVIGRRQPPRRLSAQAANRRPAPCTRSPGWSIWPGAP